MHDKLEGMTGRKMKHENMWILIPLEPDMQHVIGETDTLHSISHHDSTVFIQITKSALHL